MAAILSKAPGAPVGIALELDADAKNFVSQPYPVEPEGLYLFTFHAHNSVPVLYAVRSFDAAGQELPSDCYGLLDAAPAGGAHTAPFQARPGSERISLLVQSGGTADVPPTATVQQVSHEELLEVLDGRYAALPPLALEMPQPAALRHRHLPRTLGHLGSGPGQRPLQVVILGDSIANDTRNGLFNLLLERQFPGSHLHLQTSVRGARGAWYYQEPDLLQEYVLQHQPDLLIIAGISHNNDSNAVISVIEATRATLPRCEFLVTTGGMLQPGLSFAMWDEGASESPPGAEEAAMPGIDAFAAALEQRQDEYGYAYCDTYALWRDYAATFTARSGHSLRVLKRDAVHANDRGRTILSRILAGYFTA